MIDRSDYQRVRRVFLDVCDLDPEHRSSIVAVALADTPHLQQEVEALLQEHDRTTEALATSAVQGARGLVLDAPPERVGAFRLLEPIGRGGMGVVWRAEQDEPRRIVAVKLLRNELAAPDGWQRLLHEARLLARAQHPAIVPILAAGTEPSPSGLIPYLAMVLVDGKRIDRAIADRRMDRKAILHCLAELCDAVHHAHQRGIVHCDLKPANILLDEGGRVHVLDFGIARTIGERPALGAQRQLFGTLPYMSPEQRQGSPGGVDTRTDVYALGILAHELLTGRLPYAMGADARSTALLAADGNPVLHVDAAALGSDLAAVLAKATAPLTDHRYTSAAMLATDLRHVLDHAPVSARPHTPAYVLRCLARRHRVLFSLVAGLVLAMATAVVGTATGMLRARTAEARATSAFTWLKRTLQRADRESQGEQADLAQALADSAKELETAFANDPLTQADLQNTLGATLLSLGRIDVASRCFDAAHATRARLLGPDAKPTLIARQNQSVARQRLGKTAPVAELRELFYLCERVFGPSDRETLNAASNLAIALITAGECEDAADLLAEVIPRAARELGPDSQTTLALELWLIRSLDMRGDAAEALAKVDSLANRAVAAQGRSGREAMTAQLAQAVLLQRLGEFRRSQSLLDDLLELLPAVLGEDHPDTLHLRLAWAKGLAATDPIRSLAECEKLLPRAVALLGQNHPDTISHEIAIAYLLRGLGDMDGSRSRLSSLHNRTCSLALPRSTQRELLKVKVDDLIQNGACSEAEPLLLDLLRDPVTGSERLELATLLLGARWETGSIDQSDAMAELRKLLVQDTNSERIRLLGPLSLLARAQKTRGNLQSAGDILRIALMIAQQHFGTRHVQTVKLLHDLGAQRYDVGATDESIAYLDRAVKLREELLGADHPDTATSRYWLVSALRDASRFAEAVPIARQLVAARARREGPTHPATVIARATLIGLLAETGDHEEAEQGSRDLLAQITRLPQPTMDVFLQALIARAVVLRRTARAAEAEPLLAQALAAMEQSRDPWNIASMQNLLGRCRLEQDRPADAEPLLRAAFETRYAQRGLAHARTRQSAELLVDVLQRLGRDAEAAEIAARARPATPLIYVGSEGPLLGRRVVLVAGDDEYRSEQCLPQLARILAFHHGAHCTVLFPIEPDGEAIDPEIRHNIPGLDALSQADLLVLFTSRQSLPAAQMQDIADYVEAGKPIVGLRTAMCAFAFDSGSPFASWSWDAPDGGFGRRVLGKSVAVDRDGPDLRRARGVLADGAADHCVLTGIDPSAIWSDLDISMLDTPLSDGCTTLLDGDVGSPVDPGAAAKVRSRSRLPIAWLREMPTRGNQRQRVFATAVGSAAEFAQADSRRLLVNASVWALGREDAITADLNIALVGDYSPRPSGVGQHERGVQPRDLRWSPPIGGQSDTR